MLLHYMHRMCMFNVHTVHMSTYAYPLLYHFPNSSYIISFFHFLSFHMQHINYNFLSKLPIIILNMMCVFVPASIIYYIVFLFFSSFNHPIFHLSSFEFSFCSFILYFLFYIFISFS